MSLFNLHPYELTCVWAKWLIGCEPPGTRTWLCISLCGSCMWKADKTSYHRAYIGSMNTEPTDKTSSGIGQGRIPLSVACVVGWSQLSKPG